MHINTQKNTEIRKQKQNVQKERKEKNEEQTKNRAIVPEKKASLGVLADALIDHQQKTRFWEQMIEAWLESFSQEVNYNFVQLPEEVASKEALAKAVIETYGDLLNKKDASTIERSEER